MNERDQELTRKNIRMGMIVSVVLVLMIGLSFASVPLYRMFCQITGYDGTPQKGGKVGKILDRDIVIRFNADVAAGMPWTFHPEQPEITLKIGQQGITSFYARNNTSKDIEGTAIFNVLPEAAGVYFHKIQCFCFEQQILEAGKDAHMPVVFYVDPEIVNDPDIKDITTITLSYTFFKADDMAAGVKNDAKPLSKP